MTIAASSWNASARPNNILQNKDRHPKFHNYPPNDKSQILKKRSLGQQVLPWVAGAMVLSAVALAIFRKQDCRMATDIASADAINGLANLGGVPNRMLEQMEEVLPYLYDNVDSHPYPEEALLKKGDRLKTVLYQDWKTIMKLGVTHIKIADIINDVWSRAIRGEKEIKFNQKEFKNELLGIKLHAQPLEVKHVLTRGCVPIDPFFNIIKTWNYPRHCTYLDIKNAKTNESIKISSGMSNLIRKFGFYASSSFRVDPVQLVAVLTGQNFADLQKKLSIP